MNNQCAKPSYAELTQGRIQRAAVVARLGSLTAAIEQGVLPKRLGLTLSEAIVLGLLQQGVKVYFTVFGHGSTEVGEVLRQQLLQQGEQENTMGLAVKDNLYHCYRDEGVQEA